MKIDKHIILIVGAVLLSFIVITDKMLAKLICGFIILVLLAYLAENQA